MRTLLLAQILYGVAAMSVFAVWYGLRWRQWWPSSAGRQVMAMAVTLVLVLGSLFCAGYLRAQLPLWVFVVAFGAFDLMATGWLVLLVRTRK